MPIHVLRIPNMLYKPLLHGSYVDDWVFGIIFLIMLVVFIYFYLSDPGEDTGE